MEDYNPGTLRAKAYPIIVQNGAGSEMDRYIYNQNGEGLGSFFGSIMKNAIPFIGKTIKGGWKLAQPHISAAGKELITTGAKKGVEALTKTITAPKRPRTKVAHRPHKKRRRTKWQSL
jgi:hypothetical protein